MERTAKTEEITLKKPRGVANSNKLAWTFACQLLDAGVVPNLD